MAATGRTATSSFRWPWSLPGGCGVLFCAPGGVWGGGRHPRDLACARASGADCLLVGTGRFSVDELRRTGAEHVMTDLGDVDRVYGLLLG